MMSTMSMLILLILLMNDVVERPGCLPKGKGMMTNITKSTDIDTCF
jgi:hypothetical protein